MRIAAVLPRERCTAVLAYIRPLAGVHALMPCQVKRTAETFGAHVADIAPVCWAFPASMSRPRVLVHIERSVVGSCAACFNALRVRCRSSTKTSEPWFLPQPVMNTNSEQRSCPIATDRGQRTRISQGKSIR